MSFGTSGRGLVRGLVNSVASLHPALLEARVMDALERNAAKLMEANCLPGLQFALAVADRPVRTFCAGVLCTEGGSGARAAIKVDTAFRVASVSKPISAMVVIRMAAAGVVDLDRPVGDVLGDVEAVSRNAEAVGGLTLRRLLSHSSGIVDRNMPHVVDGDFVPTLRDALNGALGLDGVPEFERRPGERTAYSGLNYAMLELALTRLTGRTFEELAREHLFQACGSRCTFSLAARTGEGIAWEHDETGRRLPHQVPVAMASSGLVGSAADIAELLREGVEASARVRCGVLSRDAARLLFTLQKTEHAFSKFTLGFHQVRGSAPPIFDHHGHRPGLRCEVNVIPERRVTVVSLCNGERGEGVNQPVLSMVRSICSRTPTGG